MLAPLSWLKEFCPLHHPLHELAQALTLSGSKVETIWDPSQFLSGICTGRILEIQKHPDAQKLQICQIDIGAAAPSQIVTGATNVAEGQVVPVACPGAILADGKQIQTGMLRGVQSQGMLCSIGELGLSRTLFTDAVEDGIWILPPQTPIGVPILEALNYEDPTLEFEITSNRPDCFSMEGLAREAALTLNLPFTRRESQVRSAKGVSTRERLQVSVEAGAPCRRYCARRIENVKQVPSPFWMRRRLEQSGVRPISAMVDITNYVMLELGQPMHAFDEGNLHGGQIQVRLARAGETLRTLDEQERILQPGDLVIADGEGPIALAGVMGGERAEIQDQTQAVVLESACFEAATVRETASRLGMRTESSARFERIADPELCLRALERACALVEELGCGDVAEDWIDWYPHPWTPHVISVDPEKLLHFLGLHTVCTAEEACTILQNLGCKLEQLEAGQYRVETPSWRPDLEGEADLAEEVARFYDYNRIPATLLPSAETTQGGYSLKQLRLRKVKRTAVSLGYFESCTYSFMSPKEWDRLLLPADSPLRTAVRIRRAPEETSCMRTTALPSLLSSLANNALRNQTQSRLFEVLRTYHPQTGSEEGATLPEERDCFVAGVYDLQQKQPGQNVFLLKHLVEQMARNLGISTLRFCQPFETKELPMPDEWMSFHPYQSIWITVSDRLVGVLGTIHPKVAQAYEVPRNTAVVSLSLQDCLEVATEMRKQKPIPRYPATTRDLAVLVDRQVPAGQLEEILKQNAGPYLEQVELFDVYEGKNIPQGKKSIAFSLQFRSNTGTLQDSDIQADWERMLQSLAEQAGAHLRES